MTVLSLDDDIAFDSVYPAEIRRISRRFWTPVSVARRAARLFVDTGAKRVLDVGAGVGKFVLVAAEAAPEIQFVGIEHRRHLVDVASRAREALGRDNARFKAADVTRMVWSAFDGFYLFNPFAENLFEGGDCIDRRVELSTRRLERDALRVERALRRAPVGTAIVTYHGATARIPGCYEVEVSERAGTDWLRLWVRRREVDDGSLFVEEAAGVVRQVAAAANDCA
jgi:SAM-dependent methyltransferase